MPSLLVIEDGYEYEEFARLFLAERFDVRAAHSSAEALSALREQPADAFLVDLRFERSPVEVLVGDVHETAKRRFAGDTFRAIRYLKEQQGTLVLAEIRQAGFDGPAVFVHDFSPRRLSNLQRLYGRVSAVPTFDAAKIREALEAA